MKTISMHFKIAASVTDSQTAIADLWRELYGPLKRLARQRMGGKQCTVADEEDVAASVFRCLFDGLSEGRFGELAEDELWKLLLTITVQKVIDHRRFYSAKKRGEGRVISQSALPTESSNAFDYLTSRESAPDLQLVIQDECDRLLAMLEPQLQQIATRRLQGTSNQRIADELDMSVRSVTRKSKLIYMTWVNALDKEVTE